MQISLSMQSFALPSCILLCSMESMTWPFRFYEVLETYLASLTIRKFDECMLVSSFLCLQASLLILYTGLGEKETLKNIVLMNWKSPTKQKDQHELLDRWDKPPSAPIRRPSQQDLWDPNPSFGPSPVFRPATSENPWSTDGRRNVSFYAQRWNLFVFQSNTPLTSRQHDIWSEPSPSPSVSSNPNPYRISPGSSGSADSWGERATTTTAMPASSSMTTSRNYNDDTFLAPPVSKQSTASNSSFFKPMER